MGTQVVRQPDGRLAVFDSISETLVLWNASPEEVVDWFAGRAMVKAAAAARRVVDAVVGGHGRQVYHQFARSWQEVVSLDRENGGDFSDPGRAVMPLSPRVMVQSYEVSCFPEGHEARDSFTIEVAWRGAGRWAVLNRGRCLGTDGVWTWEPMSSSRTDEWMASHRFDVEEALRLACEQAPLLRANGRTVMEAWKWVAEHES